MFYGFFGHDIMKIPLSFNDSIGVLDDGLSSAVYFIIIFDSYFILINQIRILGTFNKSSFGIFSAFFIKLTSQTSTGLDRKSVV